MLLPLFWVKTIVFIVASAGIAWISRASLQHPRSHGFYRFFAWEFLIILFLLNIEYWFLDPFSLLHIISWILLVLSLVFLITGFYTLGTRGKQDENREGTALIQFEKTTVLVETGIYHFIRHPMYSSLLFLGWGIFFKNPTWLAGILAAGATAFLMVTAKIDEIEDIRFFGSAYHDYMKRTKMFIPFIL